jgi:excisionase family DNA binding protein
MKTAIHDELMTAKEIAPLFKVDPMTVHQWGHRGILKRVKIGGTVRYRKSEVDQLFATKASNRAGQRKKQGKPKGTNE